MKVPYDALDADVPKTEDVWGVNFCGRVLTGIDEWVTWSDIGHHSMFRLVLAI